MWISKKKWNALEKRVTDLEKKVQSQSKDVIKQLNANAQKNEKTRHPLVV